MYFSRLSLLFLQVGNGVIEVPYIFNLQKMDSLIIIAFKLCSVSNKKLACYQCNRPVSFLSTWSDRYPSYFINFLMGTRLAKQALIELNASEEGKMPRFLVGKGQIQQMSWQVCHATIKMPIVLFCLCRGIWLICTTADEMFIQQKVHDLFNRAGIRKRILCCRKIQPSLDLPRIDYFWKGGN